MLPSALFAGGKDWLDSIPGLVRSEPGPTPDPPPSGPKPLRALPRALPHASGGAGGPGDSRGRGKKRGPRIHAVFTVALRVASDREGNPRTELLVVRPGWVEENRWQLPGGACRPDEPRTFEGTGSRTLRDKTGRSPRGFRMDGRRVWKNADGKRYNNILLVWGAFPPKPTLRKPLLDDEGNTHSTMWIPLPFGATADGDPEPSSSSSAEPAVSPKKKAPTFRARDQRGRFLAVRGEVAKFFQFFHESPDSRRWPILEPKSRSSSRVSASPTP